MFDLDLETHTKVSVNNGTYDRLPSNIWNSYPQSCPNDDCRRAAEAAEGRGGRGHGRFVAADAERAGRPLPEP